MEKSIERMNELIQKKTKLSNSHSIEAAEIIFNLYKSDNNLESSIENLYHFHYSVIPELTYEATSSVVWNIPAVRIP